MAYQNKHEEASSFFWASKHLPASTTQRIGPIKTNQLLFLLVRNNNKTNKITMKLSTTVAFAAFIATAHAFTPVFNGPSRYAQRHDIWKIVWRWWCFLQKLRSCSTNRVCPCVQNCTIKIETTMIKKKTNPPKTSLFAQRNGLLSLYLVSYTIGYRLYLPYYVHFRRSYVSN